MFLHGSNGGEIDTDQKNVNIENVSPKLKVAKETAFNDYCHDWILFEHNVAKYLRDFVLLSGYDWHQCYGHLECEKNGSSFYDGKEFNYTLNAGGWIKLYNEDIELYLGARLDYDSLEFYSMYLCEDDWD